MDISVIVQVMEMQLFMLGLDVFMLFLGKQLCFFIL